MPTPTLPPVTGIANFAAVSFPAQIMMIRTSCAFICSRSVLLHTAPHLIEAGRFRNVLVAHGYAEFTTIVADLPVDLFKAKE